MPTKTTLRWMAGRSRRVSVVAAGSSERDGQRRTDRAAHAPTEAWPSAAGA